MASKSHAAVTATVADAAPKPASAPSRRKNTGLQFKRMFTVEGMHPYDEVAWETRTATIGNEKGEVVFQQADVEIPKLWSQMATNVVVSKYFRGALGTPERERSVKQLISRVADTIAAWGKTQGYFAADKDAEA